MKAQFFFNIEGYGEFFSGITPLAFHSHSLRSYFFFWILDGCSFM